MGIPIANAVSDRTLILLHDTVRIPFNQEIYIRDVNSEFEKLEPIESLDSVHVATATLHKDWLDIKSVDPNKAYKAFKKFYKQGEPRNGDHQADLIQISQI